MTSDEIEPTWKFFLRWFLSIIYWPFFLFKAIRDPEYRKKLLYPLTIPFYFFFEAKATAFLIILNLLIFLIVSFLLTVHLLSNNLLNFFLFFPIYIKHFTLGTFFRMLFSMFMYANIIQLLSNLFFLHIFGRIVERRYGSIKLIIIFLMGGFISMLSSSFYYLHYLHENPVMLGSAGAIMALVGVSMLIHPFKISYSLGIPLPISVLGWINILSDLSGITSVGNVTHIANLSGLFSVVLFVYLFSSDRAEMGKGLAINIISLLVLLFGRNLFIHPLKINQIFSIVSGTFNLS